MENMKQSLIDIISIINNETDQIKQGSELPDQGSPKIDAMLSFFNNLSKGQLSTIDDDNKALLFQLQDAIVHNITVLLSYKKIKDEVMEEILSQMLSQSDVCYTNPRIPKPSMNHPNLELSY